MLGAGILGSSCCTRHPCLQHFVWLRWRGCQHHWDKAAWGVLWEGHQPKPTSPVFHLHLTRRVSSVGLSTPREWVTINEGLTAIPIPGFEPSLLGRHWQWSEGAQSSCQTLLLPSEQASPCISAEATVRRDSILQKVSEGEEEALWSHIIPGLGTPTPCS